MLLDTAERGCSSGVNPHAETVWYWHTAVGSFGEPLSIPIMWRMSWSISGTKFLWRFRRRILHSGLHRDEHKSVGGKKERGEKIWVCMSIRLEKYRPALSEPTTCICSTMVGRNHSAVRFVLICQEWPTWPHAPTPLSSTARAACISRTKCSPGIA
jgi:hypothetical protein